MTLEQIILCKNLLKLLIPFLLILLVMKFDFKDRMADLGTRSRDYAEKILKKSKIRYL